MCFTDLRTSVTYRNNYVWSSCFFFFFNDTATTEIYTLSLHDALPICPLGRSNHREHASCWRWQVWCRLDRKSTRLNSSHDQISYAVFCLKKKKRQRESDASLPACRAPCGCAPRPSLTHIMSLRHVALN